MSARTQRRYSLLRRSGHAHWDAVWLAVSWEVIEIQMYRKARMCRGLQVKPVIQKDKCDG